MGGEGATPTWTLREVTMFTAECPHCGYDLLSEHDYAGWAALEGQDWCCKCGQPITANGYEIQADNEAGAVAGGSVGSEPERED